jgi:hypothetical protein
VTSSRADAGHFQVREPADRCPGNQASYALALAAAAKSPFVPVRAVFCRGRAVI